MHANILAFPLADVCRSRPLASWPSCSWRSRRRPRRQQQEGQEQQGQEQGAARRAAQPGCPPWGATARVVTPSSGWQLHWKPPPQQQLLLHCILAPSRQSLGQGELSTHRMASRSMQVGMAPPQQPQQQSLLLQQSPRPPGPPTCPCPPCQAQGLRLAGTTLTPWWARSQGSPPSPPPSRHRSSCRRERGAQAGRGLWQEGGRASRLAAAAVMVVVVLRMLTLGQVVGRTHCPARLCESRAFDAGSQASLSGSTGWPSTQTEEFASALFLGAHACTYACRGAGLGGRGAG